MKFNIRLLAAFFMLFMGFCAYAQQQEQPDILQQAEDEADRLQRILDLEDWQVFYVDSTLQHDLGAIVAEFEKLQASKVTNVSLYQGVQDKWRAQIDATYKKIFTEEQWAAYMKTAGKAMKAREKRQAKAAGTTDKKKK